MCVATVSTESYESKSNGPRGRSSGQDPQGDDVSIASEPLQVCILSVEITDADTEYSLSLPKNCKGFEIINAGDAAVRFAVTTGKVAGATNPYYTIPAGGRIQSAQKISYKSAS